MNTSHSLRSLWILGLALTTIASRAAEPGADSPLPPGRAVRFLNGQALSPARQIIATKLERIRVETVAYDGLPLGEIVKNLKDECLKRDPDKQGVNFMLNPNPPQPQPVPTGPIDPATGMPMAGPASPMETVDISSIAVKIQPPLNNVRLLDVLDAVVKVADHPIHYTIEDYGVVFGLNETMQRPAQPGFDFPGGNPHDFLEAVQKQYNVDWVSVADIPRDLDRARIPRLRISPESMGSLARRPAEELNPLAALVSLYNQIGEQKPELGRLIVKGDMAHPSVVMFAPDKALADQQPKIKVKAFSIAGLTDAEIKDLESDIERAKIEAVRFSDELRGNSGAGALNGRVATHKETSLLVATGAETFVDMVESIVTASQTKHRSYSQSPPASATRANK